MNATSIIKRVDGALKRIKGMANPIYVRTFTQLDGDPLIGRDTTQTTDTLLDPQPAYSQLSARDVVYLTSGGKRVTADDYRITLSPSSISESVLQDPTTQFVIKDGSSEEVLKIIYESGKGLQGTTVVWQVIARSVGNSA